MAKGNIITLQDGLYSYELPPEPRDEKPSDWDSVSHWQNISLDDIEGELWKDIEIFGQPLLISNMGRVKSPAKPHKPWPNILHQKRHNGYLRIKVSVGNAKYKTPNVHNFVGMLWIPNPDSLPEVNHKWGNKLDNRASSLEWITGRGNRIHAIETGLSPVIGQSGEKHHNCLLSDQQAIEISRSNLRTCELGRKYGVDPGVVYSIRSGRTRTSVTGIKKYVSK